MKELLTYVARNLVDNPDQVSVSQFEDNGETVLELRVAPEDMGKVSAVRAALPRRSVR